MHYGAKMTQSSNPAAADSRGRYATFSYLAGSIPAGGAWRDERGALFDAMDVPLQVQARVADRL